MDFFGKKKIAELECLTKSQITTIRRQAASVLELQRKIREMDQLIFSMSQCISWDQMQPIFARLKTFTDAHMIDESYRIEKVLIPEMQKTYQNDIIDNLPLKVVGPNSDQPPRVKLPPAKFRNLP